MSVPPEQRPPYRPTANPAEPETAPLRPVGDYNARRPYATEPYVDDRARVAATFWTLESLRNALALVALIAVVALGLAVWALLRRDTDRHVAHSAPATAAAITALTTRVNHLEASVRSLSSSSGSHAATTQSLESRISALEQSEKRLSAQVASAVNAGQQSQLSGRVSSLSGQLSQLSGRMSSLSGQLSQLSGRVSSLSGQVSQLRTQTTTQTVTTGTSTAP